MSDAPFDAIILAGGLGTRLRSIISDIPKPMAPVNERPFLSYLLDYLVSFSVDTVILSTGFRGEVVKEHFGDSYKTAKLIYAHEKEPLGTGGGIRFALKNSDAKDVLVLNGDTFLRVNLMNFYRFHTSNKADITLALREVGDVSRYGSVKFEHDGRINRFCEKNQEAGGGFINAGVYLINRNYLNSLHLPERFSFEKDVLESQCGQSAFYGFQTLAYFIDIGIPEDYQRAAHDFKNMLL